MAKLEEEQLYYLKDPIFYQKYIKTLNNRLIYSNNRLERTNEEMDAFYEYPNILTVNISIISLPPNHKNIFIIFEIIISIRETDFYFKNILKHRSKE